MFGWLTGWFTRRKRLALEVQRRNYPPGDEQFDTLSVAADCVETFQDRSVRVTVRKREYQTRAKTHWGHGAMTISLLYVLGVPALAFAGFVGWLPHATTFLLLWGLVVGAPVAGLVFEGVLDGVILRQAFSGWDVWDYAMPGWYAMPAALAVSFWSFGFWAALGVAFLCGVAGAVLAVALWWILLPLEAKGDG